MNNATPFRQTSDHLQSPIGAKNWLALRYFRVRTSRASHEITGLTGLVQQEQREREGERTWHDDDPCNYSIRAP